MPGMTSGLNINDPIVVAAFRAALLHQAIAALLIFAVLIVAWVAIREWRGRAVSLASLRGKAVLLTFLDPVCVTDCPLLAQEFRRAGVLLGADSSKVEPLAVNLNPLYDSTAYTRAFDRQERLARLPDWLLLTGSPARLHPVWRSYGVASQTLPAGSMLGHSDAAFVISPAGRLREELDFDPGPGTAATQSSFATELATAARAALGASS